VGLDVTVGALIGLEALDAEGFSYRQGQFARVNRALEAADLPPHTEPDVAGGGAPWSCRMWSYSGLHYLRRVAAHLWASEGLPPPGDHDARNDPLLDRCYSLLRAARISIASGCAIVFH